MTKQTDIYMNALLVQNNKGCELVGIKTFNDNKKATTTTLNVCIASYHICVVL
jgi:hypothetical protein